MACGKRSSNALPKQLALPMQRQQRAAKMAAPACAFAMAIAIALAVGLCLGKLRPPWQPNEDVSFRLAHATVHVAERYIGARTNTLVIMEHCEQCNFEHRDRQTRLLDFVLRHSVQTLALQLYVGTLDEQPWDFSLFIVNTPRAFVELRLNFPQTLHEREFYFLVVLTLRLNETSLLRSVERICSASLEFHVVNVVVMAERIDTGAIVLYAYRLVGPRCGQGISVFQANDYDALSGRLHKDELFPLHFTDLLNCVLNVCGHALPPHLIYAPVQPNLSELPDLPDLAGLPVTDGSVLLEHEDDSYGPHLLHGIDGDLLRLLASALHFRIQLRMPQEHSAIFGPGNATGCFAQLAAEESHMAIGGLSGAEEHRFEFSTSAVYEQDYFVFVVRADQALGQLNHLGRPFRHKVWAMLLLIFPAALLAIQLLRRTQKLRPHHPVETLLCLALGNAVPQQRLPRSSAARQLLASWLLLTLVLRTAYQAKLFDGLSASLPRSLPGGLGEMLEQNYTLVANTYSDFYPHPLTRLLPGNYSTRFQVVSQTPASERLATVSLANNLAYWNQQHLGVEATHLIRIREPVYLNQLVMYFRKHSIFKFTVDRKIEQLVSSGVLTQIRERYARSSSSGRRHWRHYNRSGMLPCITNDMLAGVYSAFGLLLGLAVLLFCMEVLAARQSIGWLLWLFDSLQ